MPENRKKKTHSPPTLLGKSLQSPSMPDEALAFALLEAELKKEKEKENSSALRPETFSEKEDLFEGLVLNERPPPALTHTGRRALHPPAGNPGKGAKFVGTPLAAPV